MKFLQLLPVLALAGVTATGCVDTAGTRVTINTASGDAAVFEGSTRLSNRVKIARTTYADVGGGLRKATVTLASQTHRRQRLQVRMIWSDAEGSEIDADGKPFRAVVLDGMSTVTVTGVSPDRKGVRAILVVRETETAE